MLGVEVKGCGKFPSLLKPEKSYLGSKKETTFQNVSSCTKSRFSWSKPHRLCLVVSGITKSLVRPYWEVWAWKDIMDKYFYRHWGFVIVFVKHPPPVITSHVRSKWAAFPFCIFCCHGWAAPPVWRFSKWIWNQRRQHYRYWVGRS